MKSAVHSRLDSELRLRFSCDVEALGLLSSPESASRLRVAIESLNLQDHRSFLRGYRLAVAAPLNELLWFAVDQAELLGIDRDDRLYNWLHFRSSSRGETLLSAISDPTSDLGRLCYAFNDIASSLRTAEGGLADTITAMEKCQAIVNLLDVALAGTEIVALGNCEKLPDRDSILRLCLAERVLDYAEYDPSIVPLAHKLVWRADEEFRPLDDHHVLRAETHLSDVALFPFGKGIPKEWWTGVLFGLDLILQLIGVTLHRHMRPDSDIYTAPDWIKELADLVNPSRPEGKWPSQVWGLSELSTSATRRMCGSLALSMNTVSSRHRLAAILGADRVRLISDAGATDALELEVMLSGAVATCRDSRVRVVVLTHSVDSDEREWVSIALRLPMYGSISNASKWFLFYKMYHKGMVFDSDVARAANAVDCLLQRFDDNLDVEEIGDLDSEDFLHLCTLPAFRAMRELSYRAVETNADLRSGNSELLAAHWLVGRGYRNVKVSLKRASLSNSDNDAIGVRDGQCLIVEVKGADLLDKELQLKITEFGDRIEHLRDRIPALREALECESDINEVSGLFVFLGDLYGFEPTNTSVALWGYDDFVKELKEIGLPNRIVGLLDKCHIIHTMQAGDFPEDAFFVGLEDSSEEA